MAHGKNDETMMLTWHWIDLTSNVTITPNSKLTNKLNLSLYSCYGGGNVASDVVVVTNG